MNNTIIKSTHDCNEYDYLRDTSFSHAMSMRNFLFDDWKEKIGQRYGIRLRTSLNDLEEYTAIVDKQQVLFARHFASLRMDADVQFVKKDLDCSAVSVPYIRSNRVAASAIAISLVTSGASASLHEWSHCIVGTTSNSIVDTLYSRTSNPYSVVGDISKIRREPFVSFDILYNYIKVSSLILSIRNPVCTDENNLSILIRPCAAIVPWRQRALRLMTKKFVVSSKLLESINVAIPYIL